MDSIPKSDRAQLGRIYDIVDGMSFPTIVERDAYEKLTVSEQQEYLHSADVSAIPRAYERQL